MSRINVLEKMAYNGERNFNELKFRNPDKQYCPVYGWIWNAPVTEEETLRQIQSFSRQGIKSIYIIPEPKTFRPFSMSTLLEPEYLTKEYFSQVDFAIKTAEKYGIAMWLYDEGGWPSGTACGKVVQVNPKAAKSFLDVETCDYRSGDTYKKKDCVYVAFIADKEISDGFVFKSDCSVDEYIINHKAHLRDPMVNSVDIAATRTFIDVTHEEYMKCLCNTAKNNILAVFTDEPALVGPFPFSLEFEDKFYKKTGIYIKTYLPYLYGKAKTDKDISEVFIKWYDFCSREFCDNYFTPCKKWANDHGYLFTGHVDKDDEPMGWISGRTFNVMRALRCMDVPGVDVIWQQIYPGSKSIIGEDPIRENRFFPRYASSCANQIGSNLSVVEMFGVYGAGLTFDKMRYVVDFCGIRGINVFNPLSLHYGKEGYLMTGELPSFNENQACMKDLASFNQYVNRLSYLLSIGVSGNNVALYFPLRDLYTLKSEGEISEDFEQVGKMLEKRGVSFDIIDDDVIVNADCKKLSEGLVSIGNINYGSIVLPRMKYISEDAKKNLGLFIKNGGKVYSTDAECVISGFTYSQNLEEIEPIVGFKSDKGGVREYKRTIDCGEIVFIFNENEYRNFIRIENNSKYRYSYLLDVVNEKIYDKTQKEIAVATESGEIFALLNTDKQIAEIDEEYLFTNTKSIDNEWKLKRVERTVIGDMKFEQQIFDEEYQSVALGDWREAVGNDFSGSCVYKSSFNFNKEKTKRNRVIIDLGKVNYTSELFINGKSFGVKVMYPYKYEIPSDALSDYNVIEIRVTNTMANERLNTKSFDKWDADMLTSYQEKQRIFDRESVASGLFGPVILKY